MPIAEQVGSYLALGFYSASNNGTLAFRGGSAGYGQLTWFDRQGKSLGSVGGTHAFGELRLSPDGTRVAARRIDAGSADIWLTSMSGGGETRFTFDPARELYPVWSPDGSRVAFTSDRAGATDLYQHASNGSGEDQLLYKSDHSKVVSDWSRDGRFLLYSETDPKTQRDLWVLPMEGAPADRKPVPFLRTAFDERNGRFSPDGHWVAYQSLESGRFEIYVKPFPAPEGGGGKWMISQGGGAEPAWRGDGKELFYLAPDGNVMAASVTTSGTAFESKPPKPLFKRPNGTGNALDWDVTADGQRFLFPVVMDTAAQASFTIVQNWMSLLRK